MKFFGAKTNRVGSRIVILLLTLPLLAGDLQGTAVAKTLPYLAVLAADREPMVGHGHGLLGGRDGCVLLRDGLRKPTLVVAPPGYGLVAGGRRVKLVNDTGVKIAMLGLVTTLNGGYGGQYLHDRAGLNAILTVPVPDTCIFGYVFFVH